MPYRRGQLETGRVWTPQQFWDDGERNGPARVVERKLFNDKPASNFGTGGHPYWLSDDPEGTRREQFRFNCAYCPYDEKRNITSATLKALYDTFDQLAALLMAGECIGGHRQRAFEVSLRTRPEPFLNQPHQVASRKGTHMIKTRIAGTAALFTFGLAALGGAVVAVAAPAYAGSTSSSGSSSTSSLSGTTSTTGPSTTAGTTSTSGTTSATGATSGTPTGPELITSGITSEWDAIRHFADSRSPESAAPPSGTTTTSGTTSSSNGPTGSSPTSSVSSSGGALTSSADRSFGDSVALALLRNLQGG